MFLSDLPRARPDFLKLTRAALQFALYVCRFSTVADAAGFVAEKVRVSAAVARVALVAGLPPPAPAGAAGVCAYAGARVCALPRAYIRARLPAVTP